MLAMKKFQHQYVATVSIVSFALAVRFMVSTHPHSGQGKPPMHGDYEAQRHWMEVTYNLPLAEWYRNTSNNNLLYWGLDYPPLTAYHSLALGHIAARVNGSFVHLHKSRGIETYEHKVFMRLSVLLADVLTLVPALLSFCDDSGYFFLSLLYPGFIMIDYGHFQYNCVSLGLCLAAIIGVKKNHHILASVFFSLALNYKQMELYHALPFFIFLLQSCVDKPRGLSKLVKLLGLSLTVLVTFGIIWAPFLHNMDSALAVLQRLFPFDRGLYEDKVANIWCTSNVFIKWKQLFSAKSMAIICLASTVVACIPCGVHLFLRTSFKAFLYSLVNMSLAFFLFSYHVHEKSILLVAMPALLLFQENPLMTVWFLHISHFSMLPLYVKDDLVEAYVSTSVMFLMGCFLIFEARSQCLLKGEHKLTKFALFLSLLGTGLLSIGLLSLKPPAKYPDLFTLVVCGYSCAHFVAFFIYVNWKQLSLGRPFKFVKTD